ncbi:transglutaminase family protein [Lichenicoccus roseus]|uniref:Transglutaminase family protein n=1 Tax=Lichenicoccus roseus TaxID=2683649 RepID=A0A5R9JIJ2_9PROT|nr:transglutaminase family protein [Lichenicoccus roseus]TLU74138.1 transglutaminase family protein [Lichenicoccus roseus]
MTLHVSLTHRTSYRYDRAISLGPQTIRLRPAPHSRTPILAYSLRIEPTGHFLNWLQDPQGNFLARVVFPEKVTHFDVTVDLLADMATINPFDFFLEPEAETWPFAYDHVLDAELLPFRTPLPAGPKLNALLAGFPRESQRTVPMLIALNSMLRDRVDYIVRMEAGVWTPEETLSEGRGSCRDSAWLFVQVARHLGLAARFVSGYLIQLKPDPDTQGSGPQGASADFTDLHAWAEVYLPGAGWIGFDVTSGLLTGEGHIPLAASPEPASAAPISGLAEPAETGFSFEMGVRRIVETPRTTAPYDEATWQAILSAGQSVDRALASSDVRLTMGGEPTFIAEGDMDAEEWNSSALGPTKRPLAGRLLRRLVPLWAPGAALQYTVGKHYPGEQLPRWALQAHWRRDGVPVWRDPSLLASDDDHMPGEGGADADDAHDFARALASRLQVDPERVLQAYEDIHYYLWREYRLPANVIAEAANLADPLERARLARVYGAGLLSPTGSVLPLRRVRRGANSRIWQTGRWLLRSDLLFLVPGDSSIGFRLPLQSLPWADPAATEQDVEADPFAPRPPLAPPRTVRSPGPPAARIVRPDELVPPLTNGIDAPDGLPPDALTSPDQVGRPLPQRPPAPLASADFAGQSLDAMRPQPAAEADYPEEEDAPDDAVRMVRTALTVQSRDGILHVFLPPLYAAEDWLDLVAALEATAVEMDRRIVIEGYAPPHDPRLQSFSVTPDPGVIEVNVHPAASWPEYVERNQQLYDEARAVGLGTEKFLLDGRHVGTGGGNHVVMGGAQAADSPFLRRPDLLKSLLGFWHNHPSLSYLFSGLFIGPTSQHPRIDEARQDSIPELEIAFAQIRPGAHVPPWLVDRLLRNLLADMTGNTHRTEFCIDKLYAPESSSGRLGLVELRALEMPPHPRMAAAQSLLLRAAIAAFWQHPYERRLIRWGTRLHDDFMLPHFVAEDLRDALEDLASFGLRLDPAFFAPHHAFRYPLIGEVQVGGMTLALHQALEPWPVLGETPGIGGTVRHVDNSVERVQVTVTGFSPERYVLACNGSEVPLSATSEAGTYVAGVRFKAWQPVFGMHPVLPAQTPLVFDLYDRWSGRSVGGLTHHTAHPGGRNYETRPVNAAEAEARRRARFLPFGHTPGPMAPPKAERAPELPRTLDLRRVALGAG